jgi:type I restriction enzyme S subunit
MATTTEIAYQDVPEGYRHSEIGMLPEEWPVISLGDIAHAKYGKAKPKSQGSIPVIGSGGVYGYSETPLVDFPTIIVGRKGTAGQVWLAEQPSWPSDTTFYLEWRAEVDIGFVFNYLRLNKPSGEHAKTTLPSLQKHDLDQMKLPLPPLPEQRAIAHVLSTIQRAIEATDRVIAATQKLKRSLMHHLFTYGPVPVGEAGNVPLMDTEIGLVPENWKVTEIRRVVKDTQYGLSLRGIPAGQYAILRMNNLADGHVDTSELQYVDLSEGSSKKFKLNKGDILFNRTNSHELVGKTAIFDVDGDFVFASYLNQGHSRHKIITS